MLTDTESVSLYPFELHICYGMYNRKKKSYTIKRVSVSNINSETNALSLVSYRCRPRYRSYIDDYCWIVNHFLFCGYQIKTNTMRCVPFNNLCYTREISGLDYRKLLVTQWHYIKDWLHITKAWFAFSVFSAWTRFCNRGFTSVPGQTLMIIPSGYLPYSIDKETLFLTVYDVGDYR